jgi:hypothetical protein
VNAMPDHSTGPGAGCCEIWNPQPSRELDGQPFRRRRPTYVSSADEQNVQSSLLVSTFRL